MGLLFWKKKKIPRAPFPEGRLMDDKALRFPSRDSAEVPEAQEIKEAVGFDKQVQFPEETDMNMPEEEQFAMPEEEMPPSRMRREDIPNLKPEFKPYSRGELFVKVDVYRRIIGEIDLLKRETLNLQEISKNLEDSEYNQDKHFSKMRRAMKSLHDNLLVVDKTLFKL